MGILLRSYWNFVTNCGGDLGHLSEFLSFNDFSGITHPYDMKKPDDLENVTVTIANGDSSVNHL